MLLFGAHLSLNRGNPVLR